MYVEKINKQLHATCVKCYKMLLDNNFLGLCKSALNEHKYLICGL